MQDLAVAAGHQFDLVSVLTWLFAHNPFVQMLAGFAGGMCAAFVQPGKLSQNIGRVIIGGACGYFLHSLAIPILKFLNIVIQSDALQNTNNGMAGFLVGSVGLIFFEGVLVTARTYVNKISGGGTPGKTPMLLPPTTTPPSPPPAAVPPPPETEVPPP